MEPVQCFQWRKIGQLHHHLVFISQVSRLHFTLRSHYAARQAKPNEWHYWRQLYFVWSCKCFRILIWRNLIILLKKPN
jgi:hypothetical protein